MQDISYKHIWLKFKDKIIYQKLGHLLLNIGQNLIKNTMASFRSGGEVPPHLVTKVRNVFLEGHTV